MRPPSPSFDTSFEQQPQQALLQQLIAKQERWNHRAGAAVGYVNQLIRDLLMDMGKDNIVTKTLLAGKDVVVEECVRLMSDSVIRRGAKLLNRALEMDDDIDEFLEVIHEVFRRYRTEIIDVLIGKETLQKFLARHRKKDVPNLNEEQSLMLEKFDESSRTIINMLSKGQVEYRLMTMKDIDLFQQCYRRFQMNADSVLRLIAGQKTDRTFVSPPEDYEVGVIEELLPRFWRQRNKRTPAMRRELSQVMGVIAHDKNDKDNVLGITVLLESPWDIAKDPVFKRKQEQFIEEGTSGGKMQYGSPQVRDFFAKNLLGPEFEELLIFMGLAPAMGSMTFSKAILKLRDPVPKAVVFAYILGRVGARVNGESIDDISMGQNTGSCGSLLSGGMTLANASDRNPEGKYQQFTVNVDQAPVLIEVRAEDWQHLYGSYENLKNRAVNRHPIT